MHAAPRSLGVVCLLVALGAAPLAGRAQPAATPGAIDLTRSRVYVLVGATGAGHEHGVVGMLRAGNLNLGATQAAGELVFDTTSFVADTADARRYVGLEGETSAKTARDVTANMLSSHVLDVARHPTASFRIRSARPADPARPGIYLLEGDFTLHGTTRPLRILAQSQTADGMTRLTGKFNILQTQYGITPYSKFFGAVGVADQLTIWGDLWIQP